LKYSFSLNRSITRK